MNKVHFDEMYSIAAKIQEICNNKICTTKLQQMDLIGNIHYDNLIKFKIIIANKLQVNKVL